MRYAGDCHGNCAIPVAALQAGGYSMLALFMQQFLREKLRPDQRTRPFRGPQKFQVSTIKRNSFTLQVG